MALILTVSAIFLVLVFNEFWWRRREPNTEFSRKFVHITVGSFVAFWPFFLSWNQIRLLSVAFLVVVGLSRYLHVFRAIHSVQRPTLGELYFALSVGLVTFITHDKWIYMAALLQMSLADGFAAIAGTRYGRKSYLVFSHRKTDIGTVTFFVVSLGILVGYLHFSDRHMDPLFTVGVAALAAAAENIGVGGLDNLLVPLITALVLINR